MPVDIRFGMWDKGVMANTANDCNYDVNRALRRLQELADAGMGDKPLMFFRGGEDENVYGIDFIAIGAFTDKGGNACEGVFISTDYIAVGTDGTDSED